MSIPDRELDEHLAAIGEYLDRQSAAHAARRTANPPRTLNSRRTLQLALLAVFAAVAFFVAFLPDDRESVETPADGITTPDLDDVFRKCELLLMEWPQFDLESATIVTVESISTDAIVLLFLGETESYYCLGQPQQLNGASGQWFYIANSTWLPEPRPEGDVYQPVHSFVLEEDPPSDVVLFSLIGRFGSAVTDFRLEFADGTSVSPQLNEGWVSVAVETNRSNTFQPAVLVRTLDDGTQTREVRTLSDDSATN